MNKGSTYPDLRHGIKTRITPQLRGAVLYDGWQEFKVGAPVLCFSLLKGMILDSNFHVRLIMYRTSMECAHPNGIQNIVLEYPEGMSMCIPDDAVVDSRFVIREFAYNQSFMHWVRCSGTFGALVECG
jgi:hypothetical protein